MIYLASACIGYQIASIASLNNVGQIRGLLIDPHRFSVAGFWVEEYQRQHKHWPILLSQSLRQIDEGRVFINDLDDFNDPQDLPRLRKILKIDYQIPGKKIISTDKKHLGIAEDFSFDDDNYQIVHLIVRPPLLQRLRTTRRHFRRSQIEKIRSKNIEINIDPLAQMKSLPNQLPP